MRILFLLHDAFGGRGGIAKFNRDLLTALCHHPAVTQVVALPRTIVEPVGDLPEKLVYQTFPANGKLAFLASTLAVATPHRLGIKPYDLIICGHLRLLPLLPLLTRHSARAGLILHGVDAWEPYGGHAVRRGLQQTDWFFSVSDKTKSRFLAWSKLPANKGFITYNSVDLSRFTPGPRPSALQERYHLEGKTVLMGMARLDHREQYKGFDEVMAVMPDLLTRHPNLVYMICGDGTDRQRLEQKAQALGLANHVLFTGYVDESEKVAHYRLADLFLLAGWGEGFGIVLIEAMACGVPVIASCLDASCEAVLDGQLGLVIDPKNPADLTQAIEKGLSLPRFVPPGLSFFSYEAFEQRIHRFLQEQGIPRT